MKLLVLEGLDGAGKSTQLNLIQEFFVKKNVKYKYLHYPRTDTVIWGELISMFLRGELGKIENVNPYLVALIYACDRNEAKSITDNWLKDGFTVILDRYVYSNIAYQCAKIEIIEEKIKLKNWIKRLEFDYYSLHKPDVSLFLDVPFEFTMKKLNERNVVKNRDYLKGSNDIHEQSIDFQKKVRLEYLSLVNEDERFKLIKCSDDDKNILSKTRIFEKIEQVLESYILL